MSLAQVFLIPGLDSGFSASTFVGAWLVSQRASSTGLITDERRGLGTVRPLQDGKAVTLDGTDQYGTGDWNHQAITKLSGACWIKSSLAVFTQNRTFFGTDNTVGGRGWSLRSSATTGYLEFFGSDSGSIGNFARYNESTGVNIHDGQWHHVGFSFDYSLAIADRCKFYIDGVPLAASSTSTGSPSELDSPSNALYVGIQPGVNLYTDADFFDIQFEGGVVWTPQQFANAYNGVNRTLHSGTASARHYKLDELSGFDSSGNRNDLTWNNSPTLYTGPDVPFSWQNSAGYTPVSSFTNSTPSYIDTDTVISLAGQVTTITGTVFPYEAIASGRTILANDGTAGGFYLHIFSSSIYLTLRQAGTTTEYLKWKTDAAIFTANKRFAFEIELDLTGTPSISLLIDGVLSPMSIVTAPTGVYGDSTENVFIGIRPTLVSAFSGILDGIEVVQGETVLLTQEPGLSGTGTTEVLLPRDESAPTLDVFGNALTYQGIAPSPGQLVQSNCLTLNGTDQRVSIGVDWVPAFGTPFEIEFYAQFENIAAKGRAVIGLGNSSTISPLFFLGNSDVDFSKFRILWRNNSSQNFIDSYTNASVNVGFNKFRISYNGSTSLSIYINDVLDSTHTVTDRSGTPTTLNTGNVGALERTSISTNFPYFQGQIAGLNINGERIFPCSEGPDSLYVTDTVSRTQYPIQEPGSNWGVKQDVFHQNYEKGFSVANNLLTNSETFSDITTSAMTQSVTDGVNTLRPTTSNANHWFLQNADLISGTTYYLSFEVQANGYNWIQVTGSAGFDAARYVNFNLTDGTQGAINGYSAANYAVTQLEDDWYRIVVNDVATSTTSGRLIIGVLSTNGASRLPAYTGDGTSGIKVRKYQMSKVADAVYYPTTTIAYDNVKIPAQTTDPTLDCNDLPLTNPPKIGLNNCETRAEFCSNPNAPEFFNKEVPGDGVLAAYQFDGDPGDVVIGRDLTSEEGKFSLRKS